MARTLSNVDLVYVDYGDESFQNPKENYPVKKADAIQGDGTALENKLCDVYLTAFYCHNLPDWDSVNEALLKFGTKYVPQKAGDVKSEQKANFTIDFRIRDASAPGGFLHRRVFKNLKINDELALEIKLDEIDKKYDIDPIVKTISNTNISSVLDLAGYTQYIELGSQIYNGFAELVLRDDPIWNEPNIILRKKISSAGSGAAALKQGTYCLVSTTDTKGNNLRNWESDYSNVFFKGKHLYLGKNGKRLSTNYLVFSFDFH